jgi:mono/diheme cytochrome c family protein
MMHRIASICLLFIIAACSSAPAPTAMPDVTSVATAMGNVENGKALFERGANGAPPCSTCHSTKKQASQSFLVAPSLSGVSERAANRIDGVPASDYIHASIIHPGEFIVTGFRNLMYDEYGEKFSEQEIADLTAYLLSL